MPIVSNGIQVDFTGKADQLLAEVQRVNKSFDEFKAKQKASSKEISAAQKEAAKAAADAAKQQKASWTEINNAVSLVKQGIQGVKAVFDFAKEGAQIQFVQSKFDNLAVSIGTTSKALMGDLREATGGIYSDMELMASATDFVGLGLANTADEAVRLAKVSGGLNMNMNQLVLTLTNMTTMRFDALGVRVDGFKERVQALKDAGMDADAAFKEAFLQQAEAQLNLVGNAADTTAGQFMILESNIKNTGDILKQVAATALAPIISKMNDQTSATTETRNAVTAYNEKMLETGGTLVLSRSQYNMLKDKVMEYAGALDRAAASEAKIAREDVATGITKIGEAAEMTAEELEKLSKANADQIKDAISIQSANDKYQESQQNILDKIAELNAEKEKLGKNEVDELNEINEKIADQEEAYKDGAKAFGEAQAEKLVMLALEQIALSDGVAGYSEAEAAKAELLLQTAGIAEESAFRQALAFDTAAAAIANGTMKAGELKKILDLMSKKGYTIDVAINLSNNLAMGAIAAGGGGSLLAGNAASTGNPLGNASTQAMNNWRGGDVGRGAGIPGFASGGSGGMGIVGDRQGGGWVDGVSELVFGNFTVVPSGKSKKMLQSGMLGKVPGFAFGGDMGGYTSAGSIPTKYTPSKTTLTKTPSFGGESVQMDALTQSVDQATSNAQTQANLMQNVAIQIQESMANVTASFESGFQQMIATLETTNPKAIGRQVGFELAKTT